MVIQVVKYWKTEAMAGCGLQALRRSIPQGSLS
jgi:hypothetical protein